MSKVKVAWRSNDKYSPDDVRQGKASDMMSRWILRGKLNLLPVGI
jgi:hypothetical protein